MREKKSYRNKIFCVFFALLTISTLYFMSIGSDNGTEETENDKQTSTDSPLPPKSVKQTATASLLPPNSALSTYGSLGNIGTKLEMAILRQKERNAILDDVLNNWTNEQKNKNNLWEYFWPTAVCDQQDRIGQLGDGGKWICNSHKIVAPCAVYSAGSAGDIHFETILSISPGCDIYIFDPRPVVVDQVKNLLRPNMHFYSVGMGPVKDCRSDCFTLDIAGQQHPTKSLGNLYKEYGLGGSKQLDILKLDIEGSEYWAIPYFLEEEIFAELQVKQIIIEFHSGDDGSRDTILNVVRKLEKKGYMIFQMEHNYRSPDCMEISLVHESFL